jgi:phosphoglycerate kinase
MKTLDDFDLKGKRVLLRIDLNSSVINKHIQNSLRFQEHAKTVKELIRKGAKVTILVHQRDKGDKEYTESMEEHAKILSKLIGKKIIYVNDLFGKKALSAIDSLKDSQVLMLKNTRSWSGEKRKLTPKEHSKTEFVQKLKPYFDLFVQDALSVCHRSHASVVGFPYALPSCVGRVLQKELENLEKVDKNLKRPFTLVLGGVKIGDYFGVMDRYMKENKIDYILTGGIVCLVAAYAKGIKLGYSEKLLKEKDLLKYGEKTKLYMNNIVIPIDFAVDFMGKREEVLTKDLPSDHPILDIGSRTIKQYSKIIKHSKTIFIKGSMGNYEKKGFEKGTKELLKDISKSRAFTLVGGGDTTTALQKYKIKNMKNISLSGGALLEYLAGKKLPGIEVLKNWDKNGSKRGNKK